MKIWALFQKFPSFRYQSGTAGDDLFIPEQEHYQIESFIDGSIMTIADAPWPGLTPDLLSVVLVVATQAKGSVLIHQKMFESRPVLCGQAHRYGSTDYIM